ncbi:hypothetical protein FCJ61_25375 [Burkholderia metallica]|uniref:hypothetical protein n=1 Tax=Burkholderia metallica TaxID=488729 RepID=UPI00157B914B|nr:hypothetical protein [Burkholderia metallica]NTZ86244.1 hypothetical protein [Burkholderia metallica]
MKKSINELKKDVEHAKTALYNAETALRSAEDQDARESAHIVSLEKYRRQAEGEPKSYDPTDC